MMKRIGYFLFAALLASCTLLEEPGMMPSYAPEGERVRIDFKVAVPDGGAETKAMGLNPSIDPDGFYVAVFGGSGYFNEWVKATVVSATANYDTTSTTVYSLSATLSVSDSRLRVHFIANCPTAVRNNPPISGSQDTEENVMSKIRSQKSDSYNDGYWQKVILPNGIKAHKNNNNVYVATAATMAQFPDPIVLVRNFARVYLRNITPMVGQQGVNEHQLVTIKSFAIAYAPSEGVIAPILSGPYSANSKGTPIYVADDDDETPVYFENFFMNYQRYPITSNNASDTLLTAAPFNYQGYSPSDQAYAYYPSNDDKSVPEESDMIPWDSEHPENNILFVYERTMPTAARRATRIIIKAERRDQNSLAAGDEYSEGDKFYALDIVNPSGVAVPLLRNQTYTVLLRNIEAGSGETDVSKASKASSATVTGDPNFQNLINISDGKSSIGTSYTEKFYVQPQLDSVMFRYIPTNINETVDEVDYVANKEYLDLVTIKIGSVDTDTGIFTEETTAGTSSPAFAIENNAFKVWISKDNQNKVIPYVRSNNKWVPATSAQLADLSIEKWGMVKFQLNESYKDAEDYFTEERTQAIHITGSFNDREMSRNVIIKTSPRQTMSVTCQQKYVMELAGETEVVRIRIPSGLSRSVFPLEFLIEPDGYSLTPDGDALPVASGPSIAPDNDGPSYYFVKTLTQSDYDALPSIKIGNSYWKEFDCRFKTTLAQNACTVYVYNRYFNDANACDDFSNFSRRLFSAASSNNTTLSLPNTIYRHGKFNFSFEMDYAHNGATEVWWDPNNTLGVSSSVEEATEKGLSTSNRVYPPIMTVELQGFTPQYNADLTPVTPGLVHSSGNKYLYYVGTGDPTGYGTVTLALSASGAGGSTGKVTLSTDNLTDNPNLYAPNSVSRTISVASFSTVRFGQTDNTTIDLGLNKTVTFTFTYTSGMVVPITVRLDGLALAEGNVQNNAYMSPNGDGTYTFTPANTNTTTYYLSLKTTTRFSACTVTLSHEDYETASKTASRGLFTIPQNALYIRSLGNTNPINFTTGNNGTYVYLNNSSTYSYKARTRYANSYRNSSAQTVTPSDFTIVDDDATVYFIYQGTSQYNSTNVYYYATSTLSELLAAENSNAGRVTLTFVGPVKIATTNSNYSTSDKTQTEGGVTVAFSSINQVQSDRLDINDNSNVSISVPEGYHITSIVITYYRSSGLFGLGATTYYPGSYDITSGGGTYSTGGSNNTMGTWTSENNTTSNVTIKLSGSSGNRVAITDVVVFVEKN